MDNSLLSLTHEQQQAAVEEIQKLMAQGISAERQFKLLLINYVTNIKYWRNQTMNKLWTVLALTITSHYSFAALKK
ncbi:Uncharacterized protein conserved in bacteria [Mannheimia haemolytica]|uniref:Uncharacterized protein conserved in bacteria n=1 Tax=Mannheimia haemolytica TaxID=75985 RepID=A0A378N0H0_MANHA|nr:Uncharacterized protein conserved in bacteria [Mannheimia haemolytica]